MKQMEYVWCVGSGDGDEKFGYAHENLRMRNGDDLQLI